MTWRRTLIASAFFLAFAAALTLIGFGLAKQFGSWSKLTAQHEDDHERARRGGSDAGSSVSSSSISEEELQAGSSSKLPRKDRPSIDSLDDAGGYPETHLPLPDWQDSTYLKELIREGNETAEKVAALNKEVQDKLRRGLRTEDEKGSGSVSKQPITTREKRLLRWSMAFTWETGDDYLRQLRSLGAILALPQRDNRNKYSVIRDLERRPAVLRDEDLTQIKRIFWIDDRADSVKALSEALGLSYTPPRVVTFFPEKLEQTLLKLELAFKGAREEDILETRFAIKPAGAGKFEPEVQSQKLRPTP